MSEQHNKAASASRPRDPAQLLSALVPKEPSERRRAIAALLRSVVEDNQLPGGI